MKELCKTNLKDAIILIQILRQVTEAVNNDCQSKYSNITFLGLFSADIS